jgi:hypothetical protein
MSDFDFDLDELLNDVGKPPPPPETLNEEAGMNSGSANDFDDDTDILGVLLKEVTNSSIIQTRLEATPGHFKNHGKKPMELREYIREVMVEASNGLNNNENILGKYSRLIYLKDGLIFDMVKLNILRGSVLDLHLMKKWYMNWLYTTGKLGEASKILASVFPPGLDMVLYYIDKIERTRDGLPYNQYIRLRDRKGKLFASWAEKNLTDNNNIIVRLMSKIKYDVDVARGVFQMSVFKSPTPNPILEKMSFVEKVVKYGVPRIIMRHFAVAYKSACTTDSFTANKNWLQNGHTVDVEWLVSNVTDPPRPAIKHKVLFGIESENKTYRWVAPDIPVGLMLFWTVCWNTQQLLREYKKFNINTSSSSNLSNDAIVIQLFKQRELEGPGREAEICLTLYHELFRLMTNTLNTLVRTKVMFEAQGDKETLALHYQNRFLFYCLFGCTPEWVASHLEFRSVEEWHTLEEKKTVTQIRCVNFAQ